jgi:MFS family permease
LTTICNKHAHGIRSKPMRTFRLARSLPSSVQLLLVNTFGIALGFYLLIPFLATYLSQQLHLAAAVVGAVLGLRVLCQQGLTLVGGTASDKLGPRPIIIAGCGLRAVAFGMFAIFTDATGVVVASMLVGVAGALFSPAARSYIAVEAGERKLDAFALQNVASTGGALAGPLLGSVLVAVDFRWTAGVAAVVFAGLTIWQLFVLPAREAEPTAARPLASLRLVLGHRSFLAFAAVTSVCFLLYNQFYLLLPLEAARVTGWTGATGGVFLVSTVVTLASQVRMVGWLSKRLAPGTAICAGLLVTAVAFVPLGLSATFVGEPKAGASFGDGLLAALLVFAAAILLTIGLDVAQPFALDAATTFARPGLTGTYLGLAMTASGIATALGNPVTGFLDDLGGRLSLPWLSSAGLGLAAAVAAAAILALHRSGKLATAEPTGPASPAEVSSSRSSISQPAGQPSTT